MPQIWSQQSSSCVWKAEVHQSSNNRDCICLKSSQELILISGIALLTTLFRINNSLIEFYALSPDKHSHRQLPGLLYCLGVSGSCWHRTGSRILASGQCTTVKGSNHCTNKKDSVPSKSTFKSALSCKYTNMACMKSKQTPQINPAVKYNCSLDWMSLFSPPKV